MLVSVCSHFGTHYLKKSTVAFSGTWTVNASLIRNLAKVCWFGTLRVLEEDKPQMEEQKRETPELGTGIACSFQPLA